MRSLASLLFLALAAGCSAPSADIMPRFGSFDVGGHFGVTTSDTGPVPEADMEQAGFDKDNGYVGLRADFNVGSPTWYISVQSTSHGGSGTVGADLSSGDGSISAGDPVATNMDLGLYQAGVTFDLVPGDRFEAGIGFGISTIDLDADMTDLIDGESIDVDRTLPIPVLALRGGVDLGDFDANALISVFDLEIDGDRASYFDLDVLARYRVIGGDNRLAGSIGLGYRMMQLGLQYEDDGDRVDTDLRFNGPYLTLVLSL